MHSLCGVKRERVKKGRNYVVWCGMMGTVWWVVWCGMMGTVWWVVWCGGDGGMNKKKVCNIKYV